MESYDVIIIGGGIAGTGLAYNLSQECPHKSVLLIEKDEIGGNAGYGYRIIFKDTIDRYKLPFSHKYKYFNVGAYDKIYFKVFHNVYFVDYKQICNNLFRRGNPDLTNDEAISVDNNILKGRKQDYKFQYLIDCSGNNSFLAARNNRPYPYINWINKSRIITNDNNLNDKSFYYMFSDTGYFEEIYPLKDRVIHADWLYTRKPEFNKIRPHIGTLSKKLKIHGKIIKEFQSVVPVAPVLPLTKGNYAFLGDSFGNADPAVGMGIKLILESSKILTNAIKQEDLTYYNIEWKKIFLNRYIKWIASKLDRYHCPPIIQKIKNYPSLTKVVEIMGRKPDTFLNMLKNEDGIEVSNELKRLLPKIQIVTKAYYYLLLNLKYYFMELRYL